MSLPGLEPAPALFRPEVIAGHAGRLLGYNLFLALFPPPEIARRLGQTAAELRERHGLRGPCLQIEHLHLTLHTVLGFPDTAPMSVIDAARAAAAGAAGPPLPIVFDRACSFINHGERGRNAFVLRCTARSDAAVAPLRHKLALALRQSGLQPQPSSTPHVTMLYDRQVVTEHPIEPIHWTATHLALVLSHRGLSHYEVLGDWQLA